MLFVMILAELCEKIKILRLNSSVDLSANLKCSSRKIAPFNKLDI